MGTVDRFPCGNKIAADRWLSPTPVDRPALRELKFGDHEQVWHGKSRKARLQTRRSSLRTRRRPKGAAAQTTQGALPFGQGLGQEETNCAGLPCQPEKAMCCFGDRQSQMRVELFSSLFARARRNATCVRTFARLGLHRNACTLQARNLWLGYNVQCWFCELLFESITEPQV